MLEKFLGKDVPLEDRAIFLRDNSEAVEIVGYMKPFTPDEIQEMKDGLSEMSIKINDIEEEKKIANDEFKVRLKPLLMQKQQTLQNIKHGAIFVQEDCFRFVDTETRMVGWYNSEGELINQRPALTKELQGNLFPLPKTGTND